MSSKQISEFSNCDFVRRARDFIVLEMFIINIFIYSRKQDLEDKFDTSVFQ